MSTSTSTILSVPMGDARDYRITATKKSDGTPYVFQTNDKLVFTIKRSPTDATPLVQRKSLVAGGSDAEVAIVSGTGGIVDVHLLEADTLALTPPGTYVWDLVVQSGIDGKERTVVTGQIRSWVRVGPAIP